MQIDNNLNNLEYLKQKPENEIFLLKKENSRTHYLLWWDNFEYMNIQKSYGKIPDETQASLITENDVESYIQFYFKKSYSLYKESEVKLNVNGTIKI